MTPRPLTDAERAEGRAFLSPAGESSLRGAGCKMELSEWCFLHAEALLDAADELARLKAKLAAVREHAATFDNADGESAFLSIVDCPYNEPLHHHHDGCPECTEHAPPTTFRDDAATTPEGHEATTSDTASINAAISKLQDTIERARMAAAAGDLHGALDALEGKK